MRLYIDAETQSEVRQESRELIPRRLLQAMFALIIFSLALVSFSVLTGRDMVGQPKAAAVVQERSIILGGQGDSIRVTDPSGALVLADNHGGFLSSVRQALMFERSRHGVEGNPPVFIRKYENGRLQIADPSTDWKAELTMFGKDNTARWEQVLAQ